MPDRPEKAVKSRAAATRVYAALTTVAAPAPAAGTTPAKPSMRPGDRPRRASLGTLFRSLPWDGR